LKDLLTVKYDEDGKEIENDDTTIRKIIEEYFDIEYHDEIFNFAKLGYLEPKLKYDIWYKHINFDLNLMTQALVTFVDLEEVKE
jgi:hypothetical protein